MDVCPVCQADFVKGSGMVCPECQAHVDLGRKVIQAGYLVRLEGEGTGDFTGLGFCWQLEADWQHVSRLVETARAKTPRKSAAWTAP